MKHEFSACIGVDDRGHLRIEDADAVDLAEEFGTPFVAEIAQRVGRRARVNPRTRLTLSELDNVDAAGRAAARTGLAVSTHSVASPIGLEHLRLLCEEAADPARVVI